MGDIPACYVSLAEGSSPKSRLAITSFSHFGEVSLITASSIVSSMTSLVSTLQSKRASRGTRSESVETAGGGNTMKDEGWQVAQKSAKKEQM